MALLSYRLQVGKPLEQMMVSRLGIAYPKYGVTFQRLARLWNSQSNILNSSAIKGDDFPNPNHDSSEGEQ